MQRLFPVCLLLSSFSHAVEGWWAWDTRQFTNYHDTYKFLTKEAAAEDYCGTFSAFRNTSTRIRDFVHLKTTGHVESWHLNCEYLHSSGNWFGFGGANIHKISPCPAPHWPDIPRGQCAVETKNQGEQCPMTDHPVNPLTGSKFYLQRDYIGSDAFPLKVSRYYNSFGSDWSWDYFQRIDIVQRSPRFAEVHRPDGKVYIFTENGTDWVGDTDDVLQLNTIDSGFKLTLPNNTVETYDADGKLTTITTLGGLSQSLAYVDNQVTVSSANSSITFDLNTNDQVERLTLPDGSEYRYGYNSDQLLETISVPDTTPGQAGNNPFGEDNPFKVIHREDATFRRLVTGITDETGTRISTAQYDAMGRVVRSEISGGISATSFDYTHLEHPSNPRVTLTNSLGKETTYHYKTIEGLRRLTLTEGHATAHCAAANQSYTYDANGFKDLVTDWEGNVTDYDHDFQGREISRTEGVGTPEARTITTEWHTTFRLPTKMTYPERVVNFVYDENGNLVSRVVSSNF